ncbi:NAD(P)H-hydrate dehydratase [Anaeromyxobacter oryzae]|uniref:Bifunctional NAD(P)H-hydrate repair enzyme n=1 Tax=Anaeromyxobacter oryzae TaxID=2918170 RepID=A0ABM7X3H6_9BACT|nr:NAD(P)H-hydrate dehydratase [Anaeromyxobacter oryzae]BDG06352.1 bifunctional NAD(P)H-hydrate repair enzyme Nnr [Anaeromyxobacter oryzae]
MRLVGSAEMREIDRIAIAELGIPSLTLMDRAGRAVAEAATAVAGPRGRFVVVAGGGNNGGDGYVVARVLRSAGRDARVVALVPAGRLSGDARAVREQAERAGVPIDDGGELAPIDAGVGDVVVDAIFGTGLSRAPEGAFAEAIARIEAARVAGARVVAVDVPSGLSADTGRPLGPCVRADRTVTFAFQKRGLVLHPGPAWAGEVTVADIGIPPEAARRVPVAAELLTEAEARLLVPPRAPDAHKGDAGRLLVIAGSPGKTGAAHLALTGALRGGAGLVTLAARAEVLPVALAGRPEAMSVALPGAGPLARADLQALLAAADGVDALAIGPGIPRGPETAELLAALLERAGLPTVLDADALNAFAEAGLPPGARDVPVVVTPHPGEMARLCGISIEAVQSDRIGLARARARAWNATVVLKGARTVVADPEGPPAVIPTGNPGLATGGTGDVLAGLVGALLAGGLAPAAAARAAAWVHGRAGDLAAARLGQRGLLAGDLGEAIGAVWAEWRR